MPSSKSSTQSSQAQSSLSAPDSSVTDLSGSSIAQAVKVGGGTFRDVNVAISQKGLTPEEGQAFLDSLAGYAEQGLSAIQKSNAAALDTVSAIAKSATGTQSETGQLLNKWTTPALLVLGMVLLTGAWHTPRRK